LSPRTLEPAHPRTHVARGSRAFWKINLAVFSAGFSVFLLMYAVQPLLPIFTREFHISAPASSLALSVTTGCLAVSMLVIGAVAEGWSRKPLMSASLLAAALLTLVSSVVRDWPMFLMIRAIEGIAIAGLPALAMAYLGEEIHPDSIGVSMGLYVGAGALGGMEVFVRAASSGLSSLLSFGGKGVPAEGLLCGRDRGLPRGQGRARLRRGFHSRQADLCRSDILVLRYYP